jgi:hypothetical protein
MRAIHLYGGEKAKECEILTGYVLLIQRLIRHFGHSSADQKKKKMLQAELRLV